MTDSIEFEKDQLSAASVPSDKGETNLSPTISETVETDKTYSVSNEEFMRACFAKAPSEALPMVVGFSGHPGKASAKNWAGKPWARKSGELEYLSQAANNYFSLPVFAPDGDGNIRRRKTNFTALCAVMLDDVGTKVPLELVNLRPTWLFETSPGNFQAGYLLTTPLTDPAEADQLMKAIINKGLCDPGAGGPTARLARLPVGGNGKHSPVFQCRPAQWNPDLTYSVEALIEGFDLEMKPAGRANSESASFADSGHGVLKLAPVKNLVLAELERHGWLKAKLGEGRHDITCPWVKEHTNEEDGGAAYFEPSSAYPLGGFSCQHGHCAKRHLSDLLNTLGLDQAAARSKATINVVPGDIDLSVDALETVLARSGRYFQKSNHLVEVNKDPGTSKVSICQVSQAKLAHTSAALVEWRKHDKRSDELVKIDPPARVISMLHEKQVFGLLPILEGIARQPFFRSDETLVGEPGYDSQTRKYGDFDAAKFSIPERPTEEDARRALSELKELLSEFPFATKSDTAAALSGMLTAAVRPSLPHAPMLLINAHSPGSGKSCLSALITVFATAQIGVPLSLPEGDTECQKLLLALLTMSPAVIEFDNLTRDIEPMPSLCSVLTSEAGSGRRLGVSEVAEFSTQTLFLASGNNISPVRDMVRRTVRITLDPATGTPALRTFSRPNLVEEVRRNREKFVSLAITIIRAYFVAGRPSVKRSPLVNFEVWNSYCRDPLVWLGEEEPIQSIVEAMDDDPDLDQLHRFLMAWRDRYQDCSVMVRKVIADADVRREVRLDDELLEILFDIAGERGDVNRRKLGQWIKRQQGRVVEGLKIIKGGGSSSAQKWRVVEV